MQGTISNELSNRLTIAGAEPNIEMCLACKNRPAVSAVCLSCQKKHISGRVHSARIGYHGMPAGLCPQCQSEEREFINSKRSK